MKQILTFIFIVIHYPFTVWALEEKGTIELRIEQLKSNKGVVQILLFKNPSGFPDTPSMAEKTITLPIEENISKTIIKDIPYGTYAIACIHDENSNQKQDTNFFGYPIEGYGTSKNPTTNWKKPTFEEAKFNLEQNLLNISIKIKYLP